MDQSPSTQSSRGRTILKWCELGVGILLTGLLLFLHSRVFTYAGPLWRDEICSLHLATMSTLQELWRSLVFDPFPAVYFVVLRTWHSLGFGNDDAGLRLLGLLIGGLLIAALWVNC